MSTLLQIGERIINLDQILDIELNGEFEGKACINLYPANQPESGTRVKRLFGEDRERFLRWWKDYYYRQVAE